jgi:hypothetical protein
MDHGGSMLVVEYEGIEKPRFYMWKNVAYEPDYYMSESLKKPFGLYNIPALAGYDPREAGPDDAAAAHDHGHMHGDMGEHGAVPPAHLHHE